MSVTEWWTQQQGVWIGAIGGSSLGVLGGLLGSAIGVCAVRGKLRGPIVTLHVGLALACIVLLVAGAAANLTGQPYHVFYPLMLGGSIGVGVLGALLPLTLWSYRLADARAQLADGIASDPNFNPPAPPMVRALVESWGSGGSLRRLSLGLACVMGVIVLGAAGAAVALALNGAPFRSWFAWTMLATGPAIAAGLCWLLPRTLLATANAGRGVLDQQRLAAEEFRRG